MAVLAMWFQDATTTGMSSGSEKMIAWSLVVIAAALGLQALIWIGVAIGALMAIKKAESAAGSAKAMVDEARRDLRTEINEIKGKLYPVIDSVNQIGVTAKNVLADAEPKIKIITEHLADTTRVLKDSAERVGQTVGDANTKTQRQVARVDGMVTGALNTLGDVVHAIEHGIKVPAQKLVVATTEARFVVEGFVDRLKGMASALPFVQQRKAASKSEKIPASPAGYRPPVQRTTTPVGTVPTPVGTVPPSATGHVPLVK